MDSLRFSGKLSRARNFTYHAGNVQAGSKHMSDRKYRQRGYMDNDREPQQSKPQQKPRDRDREGPRSPKMMAFGETVKCASCGAKAPSNITFDSSCTNCRAELHSCRQCNYFDPSARFECSKPITTKIVNKSARNVCDL